MSCPTGKQRHQTKQAAVTAARKVGERKGKRLSAYRCDRCSGWHAGSTVVPYRTAPATAFGHTRPVPADDPKGTVYCPDPPAGCGHPAALHVGGTCLGRRGACPCTAARGDR